MVGGGYAVCVCVCVFEREDTLWGEVQVFPSGVPLWFRGIQLVLKQTHFLWETKNWSSPAISISALLRYSMWKCAIICWLLLFLVLLTSFVLNVAWLAVYLSCMIGQICIRISESLAQLTSLMLALVFCCCCFLFHDWSTLYFHFMKGLGSWSALHLYDFFFCLKVSLIGQFKMCIFQLLLNCV